MLEQKDKFTGWQKFLITLGIISISVVVFPLTSLVLFSVLYKLTNSGTWGTLAVAFPFTWAPILGLIFGIIIGIKITSCKQK